MKKTWIFLFVVLGLMLQSCTFSEKISEKDGVYYIEKNDSVITVTNRNGEKTLMNINALNLKKIDSLKIDLNHLNLFLKNKDKIQQFLNNKPQKKYKINSLKEDDFEMIFGNTMIIISFILNIILFLIRE